jgi:hypothetical protein
MTVVGQTGGRTLFKWDDRVVDAASMVLLALFITVSASGSGVGQRYSLTSQLQLGAGQAAQVFVPDYFSAPSDGQILLVIHLHGGVGASEDMVYRPRANAVLFSLELNGLSGVYQNYFADPLKFSVITNLVTEVLRTNHVVSNPGIGRLVLTSFSAGYAGIREILKSPGYYQRVDALLLGDTLYSSSDPAARSIQMQNFLQFAADARDLKKLFLLTHSTVATSGYDNTVATADYLVSGIGAGWMSASAVDAIGTQYRLCDAGQFQAIGYLGSTGTDHVRHYQNMDLMMERFMTFMAETNSTELRFTTIALENGKVQLGLTGPRGRECVLESSTNLDGWKPVSTVTLGGTEVMVENDASEASTRFFRARSAAAYPITPFETYASGAMAMFQSPAYSGSTSAFLEPGSFAYVTNVFPSSSATNTRALQANWTFKNGETNPWLRLTTYNAPNLPNPTISLTGALRFDIYTTQPVYVTLGIRETGTTAAFGANGGVSGGIEWVGGSTQNSSPPLGRFVPPGAWTRLVFFIPHEPIGNFFGDGILSSTSRKGTLEHLAFVPAGGSGPCTVYLDNLQVIE